MLNYEIIKDPKTGKEWIETTLKGKQLLSAYLLNKGTAFTYKERCELGLLGKLPAKIETLDEQVERAYRQYKKYRTDLQRHVYLNNMHDKNEVLFYKLVREHLVEMIPIVYTPIVGQAVKEFSHEFRQPRGLYIAFPDQDKMELILQNRTHPHVSVIVVTDGERVLGIGDQGIGAINIPIAKLMLYTMCGGLNPYYTLPIYLDVGTDNQALLDDPFYLGWRHPRIRGKEYDQFIEKFVNGVKKTMPGTFLHWEDFGRDNARRILDTYRLSLCTFNDDMQGTSVVTLAAILSAVQQLGKKLDDQKIVIYGAGTAGVGIADRLVDSMERLGIPKAVALERIWLIDKDGLIVKSMKNILPFQIPYAKKAKIGLDLESVVKKIKPTILIGCAAAGGAFTKKIVQSMASHTPRPIILPLSNPNEKSEAHPEDLIKWTKGKALVATGSPFKGTKVAQCNNAFSFPGIGLGIVAAKASTLTDSMLWAACQALSEYALQIEGKTLLPPLEKAPEVAKKIAIALVKAAQKEGVAGISSTYSAEKAVSEIQWQPYYRTISPKEASV